MCTLEKLNFTISRGSMPLDPPSLLAPPALYLGRTNFELLPPGWLFPIGNTYYDITYLTYTKTMFLFLVEKGAPPALYRDIYFKDC